MELKDLSNPFTLEEAISIAKQCGIIEGPDGVCIYLIPPILAKIIQAGRFDELNNIIYEHRQKTIADSNSN